MTTTTKCNSLTIDSSNWNSLVGNVIPKQRTIHAPATLEVSSDNFEFEDDEKNR